MAKIIVAMDRLFLCCALAIALCLHCSAADDLCAQRKNPADVCTGTGDVDPVSCSQEGTDKLPVCKGDGEMNRIPENRPYVVLVSLDGFRWDYASKYGAEHLQAIAREGASAPKGMIPSYPSLTFPNHYTIVTGLYPEHHGIVANSFYEPACMKRYSYKDPNSNPDGRWYGGIPLWSLAEQQGMRSACLFWPGSEAKIAGKRPTYFLKFNDKTPEEARIDQIIAWLHQPAERRPHFITLYYSNVDHAGHDFGPESRETREQVKHVDELMGKLWDQLRATGKELNLRIDLIILSDHGMTATRGDWIDLDHFADLSDFVIEGAFLYPKTADAAAAAYSKLVAGSDFSTYRRSQMPAELHYDENARTGDPVVVPKGPYGLRAHHSKEHILKGEHGYDPQKMTDMRAIFYAAGPDIRKGIRVDPFENVDVYPFIAKILGLDFCQIDGKVETLQSILIQRPK